MTNRSKALTSTSNTIEWAEFSKDVLSFHNTRKGGVLIFGIRDKDYEVVGLAGSGKVDSKIINDKISKYVGDQLWVDYYYPLTIGDKNIALVIIPPLHGSIKRFMRNSPEKR